MALKTIPTSYEQLRQKPTCFGKRCCLWALTLLLCVPCIALGNQSTQFSLDGRLSVLRDASAQFTQEEVARKYEREPEAFQPSSGRLAAGFDNAIYWFRLDLTGLEEKDRLVLDVGRPHLHSIRVYQPDARLSFKSLQQGQAFANNQQAPVYRGAAFYLDINESSPVVYIRIESTTTLVMTVNLWEESEFYAYQANYNLLVGFLYGALVFMLVLGLVQFVFTRQVILLLFAGYQLVTLALYFTLHGYLKLYFFPGDSVLPLHLVGFFSCLTTGLLAFLTVQLLNLKKISPYFYKGLLLFGFAWIACSSLSFLGLYPLFAEQAHQLRLLLILIAASLSLYLTWQGSRVALLFFLGFFPQLFLVGLRSLSLLGVMPLLLDPDLLSALVLASHLLQITLVAQGIRLELKQLSRSKREMEIAYQKALQKAQLEQQTSLAQKDFMSMLAHEFRNPLAVINNVAALLPRASQHKTIDPVHLGQHLNQASRKLAELLESCLTDERLSSGLRDLQPCNFSFAKLLKKLQQELDPEQQRLRIKNQNIDKCHADPILLALALRNLLDNALSYSPDNQPVTLKVWQEQQDLVIRISDLGAGIGPAEQEVVFERFYRGQAGQKVACGYGLGLYLVKQIVKLHQGSIELTSPLGKGACFTLRLPAFPVLPIKSNNNNP